MRRQILLTAMGIVSLASVAHADDDTGQPQRVKSSNPAFFLSRGQALSDSTYEYSYESGDIYNYSGVLNRSFAITDQTLIQRFTYGVTSNLEVYIEGSGVPTERNTSRTAGGGVSTTHSSGAEDPLFGVFFRALSQNKFHFNLDIGADYAPDIVSAQLPSPTQDGSVAIGGQRATMMVAASHIWDTFTLRAAVNATYVGTRRDHNPGPLADQFIEPFWQYDANVLAYAPITTHMSAVAGVGYTVAEKLGITTPRGTQEAEKPGNQTTLTVGVNFDVSQRFSVRLEDQEVLYANSGIAFPTAAASNSYIGNERQNVASIRLSVVF